VPLYSPIAQRWEELLRGFGQKKHQEPPWHSVVTTGAACGSRKPARGWLKAEALAMPESTGGSSTCAMADKTEGTCY